MIIKSIIFFSFNILVSADSAEWAERWIIVYFSVVLLTNWSLGICKYVKIILTVGDTDCNTNYCYLQWLHFLIKRFSFLSNLSGGDMEEEVKAN